MRIETERLLIRDLDPTDEDDLRRIVRQKNVVRFMRDWSDLCDRPGRLRDYIAWHQTQKDSTDVRVNKRYAIALKARPDAMIGMVGMGMEDTLREVEMAYFLDEAFQGCGYATEAVIALFDWCMAVSDLPYMILTIDCANASSARVAERSGFELFERRYPMGHQQPNMESSCYDYYRKYRQH